MVRQLPFCMSALKKTFDKIGHKTLPSKLGLHEFTCAGLDLSANYLSHDRSPVAVLNNINFNFQPLAPIINVNAM